MKKLIYVIQTLNNRGSLLILKILLRVRQVAQWMKALAVTPGSR